MTNLYKHEYYQKASYASNSRQSANVIGGGYLAPKHREAVGNRYGSVHQLYKFRIIEDEIQFKPHMQRGIFGVTCKIESPEDLKGIATYGVYPEQDEDPVYDLITYTPPELAEPDPDDEPFEEEDELNTAI